VLGSPSSLDAHVFDTNVRALFNAMRHEIPALLTSGGGAFVNNTSVSGVQNPDPGLALYGASKAAAIALTRAAAMEYAPQGVRINSVAPGRVVTEMMLASGIADMRSIAAGLPLRRRGIPRKWLRPRFGCCRTRPLTSWAMCCLLMVDFLRRDSRQECWPVLKWQATPDDHSTTSSLWPNRQAGWRSRILLRIDAKFLQAKRFLEDSRGFRKRPGIPGSPFRPVLSQVSNSMSINIDGDQREAMHSGATQKKSRNLT
jgi:hypothetical protein